MTRKRPHGARVTIGPMPIFRNANQKRRDKPAANANPAQQIAGLEFELQADIDDMGIEIAGNVGAVIVLNGEFTGV